MRKHKDKIFDTLKHGPFTGHIRVNKQGQFSAEFGPDSIFSPVCEDVRRWLIQRMRQHCALKWQPVMDVHFDNEDEVINSSHNCSNLACRIERYYIAWTGEKWVFTPWVVMRPGSVLCSHHDNSVLEQPEMSADDLMMQRVRHARDFSEGGLSEEIDFPITEDSFCQRRYIVAYTEENWTAMLSLLDKMRSLRGWLNDLLGRKEGWERLRLVSRSSNLLGPG